MSVWDFLEGSMAAERLSAQISSGEAAHAWLLVGPNGSGKRPAALAIAAALNCPVRPLVGCGECSTCTRIIRSRYPDTHHIVPEGPLIPVDTIRDVVLPEASRSPFEGRHKVFIIEDAERMNPPAQNALLKTLEEPHADTTFVLISDREDELLDTVRSRCRIVHLEPVSEQRIVELLTKYGADRAMAVLAARLSEGDYEKAREYAIDPAVRSRRDLWISIPPRLVSPSAALDAAVEIIDRAAAAVGERESTQKQELSQLLEAVGQGRGTAPMRNAITKRHRRELRRVEENVLGESLSVLSSFYRDVLALRTGGEEAVTNIDRTADVELWARSELPSRALVAAIDRCLRARASLVRNANVALAMEATLVELSARVAPPAGVSVFAPR